MTALLKSTNVGAFCIIPNKIDFGLFRV